MKLSKFTYCLVSHKFDDTPTKQRPCSKKRNKSSELDLHAVSEKPRSSKLCISRVLLHNAKKKIIVGKKNVKITYTFLTITFMEKPVFEVVAQGFESQMENYMRAKDLETKTGLRSCFNISKKGKLKFSELLPLTNYFLLVSSSGVVCLMIVSDGVIGLESNGGPAIILGNYQQQRIMPDSTFLHRELKWLMEDLIKEPKNEALSVHCWVRALEGLGVVC
ncbi:aspartic proteinase nepenthesin-1 [Pyrus ussuriensis x Pyrus communis]|uniref:Aspartic proteinase nepenthesin-1 n=1 Tax=Pyrus ussuriensis x Pyrus communis TaxID=2448454 RepID=A0A5N5FBU0_9ROSA|nr:aspartic proteinase nepenthesin-1 [Pyrus ussuriensis x Pyrus communis]